MRWVLVVWIGGCLLAGCVTQQLESRRASRTSQPVQPGTNRKPATTAPAAAPVATADDYLLGRVASVHPTLRFVVMDFGLRRMPVLEQRLNVYRAGQKVGEVKVTGPVLETTIAGDIMAGEAQAGDQVRED